MIVDLGLILPSNMCHRAGIKVTVLARGATLIMEPSKILTPDVVERLSVDIAQARGLPGAAYGADFYSIEQRKLFPRVWCVAGFASELENAGDVKPVDLAGWPVLLVRDTEGEIRAFHNLCRHRSMRLANEPCNVGNSLVCPWHAWRYGLDGRLMATPRVGGERQHQEPGLERDELGLVLAVLGGGVTHRSSTMSSGGRPTIARVAATRQR